MTENHKFHFTNPFARIFVMGSATCFYTSSLPVAFARLAARKGYPFFLEKKLTGAGVIGSVWGVITFFLLIPHQFLTWPFLVGAGLFSVFISHFAEKGFGTHDDSRIIIDEWAGMLFGLYGLDYYPLWSLFAAFALFRFFDSWKGPWGHALQKLPGGWGVVMDDLAAGALANIIVRLITP